MMMITTLVLETVMMMMKMMMSVINGHGLWGNWEEFFRFSEVITETALQTLLQMSSGLRGWWMESCCWFIFFAPFKWNQHQEAWKQTVQIWVFFCVSVCEHCWTERVWIWRFKQKMTSTYMKLRLPSTSHHCSLKRTGRNVINKCNTSLLSHPPSPHSVERG